MVVLALACLMILVLVTFCANLANLAQARRQEAALKRSCYRVPPAVAEIAEV